MFGGIMMLKKLLEKEVKVKMEHIDTHKCRFMGDVNTYDITLVDKDFNGAINGSSEGTISLREIITYVEQKTGTKAVIDEKGDAAPYNGEPEYSINTDKAKELGFRFSELHDWIYELLDHYIECGGYK